MKNKKANQVFDIIRKLDNGEKRAFNIYASAYETKSNAVLALFNIIYDYTHALAEGQEPSESDIRPQLKKANLNAQYVPTKSRLKNDIFLFLYQRMLKDDDLEQIKMKMSLSISMMKRGQKDASMDLLKEAHTMAQDYEAYESLLIILGIEQNFLSHDMHGTEAQLEEIMTENREVQKEYAEMRQAIYELDIVRRRRTEGLSIPAHISTTDQILERIKASTSVTARHHYYLLLDMLADPQSVTGSKLDHQRAHLSMLEENFRPLGMYVMRYFTACFTYLRSLIAMGDAALTTEWIRTMEAKFILHENYLSPHGRVFVEMNLWRHKIMDTLRGGDIDAIKKAASEAEIQMLKNMKQIDSQGISVFKVLLRDAYFYSGEYARAAEWATGKISKIPVADNMILPGYIIEMISAYETDLPAESMRAVIKRLRYQMNNLETSNEVVTFMEGIVNLITQFSAARNAGEKEIQLLSLKALCGESATNAGIAAIIRNSNLMHWLQQYLREA